MKVIKNNILFSNKTIIYLSRSISGNVGSRDTMVNKIKVLSSLSYYFIVRFSLLMSYNTVF